MFIIKLDEKNKYYTEEYTENAGWTSFETVSKAGKKIAHIVPVTSIKEIIVFEGKYDSAAKDEV